MATIITDEHLTGAVERDPNNKGAKVSLEYLMPIPAEDRYSVASLAQVITNRSPGYRYSDGLYAATKVYSQGGRAAVDARTESDR